MAIVKIFYGRGYDVGSDRFQETKRPGRREILLRWKLEVLENRVYEVDDSSLDADGFLKPELMVGLSEESDVG